MISESAIRDILALYDKHGWTLRRVLFSENLTNALSGSLEILFGRVEIVPSELDALWFSRSSRPESEAWELRHLSETPFALVEVIDHDFDDVERSDAIRSAEIKMSGIVQSRKPGN